jgi:predicted RNase H-like nuclease (RuvC/YqgF family)
MSEIWKKFKGVFVVEDPNAAKKATPPPAASSPSVSAPPVPTVAASTVFEKASGQVNQRFTEVLFNAMGAANQPGFDYFEFKQALQNLQKVAMDDATRYRSAFAMAQAMGATPEKLIQSAQSYLGVLSSEQTKFLQAADNHQSTQLGGKQTQIANLQAAVQQKENQIQQLMREMEQHKQELAQLRTEIEQADSKLIQTKADFSASYSDIVRQIQSDMQNMKTYLG